MYAALAAKSEPPFGRLRGPTASGSVRLSAPLLHEDNIRRADSLDEQLRRPADFGNQRIRLDAQLVNVVRLVRQTRVLAQLDVVTRDRKASYIHLRRIAVPFDGFVEGEFVAAIWSQIQARRELPGMLERR